MTKTLQALGLSAFKQYSQNLIKLRAFELKPVVKEYLKLKNELDSDAMVVKEAAKESMEGFSNKQVKVVVIRNWRKWYDVDVLKTEATPKEWNLIKEKCLTMELDKISFEKLVKDKDLPKELKQAAFMEKEMTPRVSIKEIND